MPACRNRGDAATFVATLEGDPAVGQAWRQGDAQPAKVTTLAHPPLDHARARGLVLQATLHSTPLAPGRDDIPGVPESREIVEEGPVRRHEQWGIGSSP